MVGQDEVLVPRETPQRVRRLLRRGHCDGEQRAPSDARKNREGNLHPIARSRDETPCDSVRSRLRRRSGRERAEDGSSERGEDETVRERRRRKREGREAVERGRDEDVGLGGEEREGVQRIGELHARRRKRLQREREFGEGDGVRHEREENDAVIAIERGLARQVHRDRVVVCEVLVTLLRVEKNPRGLVETPLESPGGERRSLRNGERVRVHQEGGRKSGMREGGLDPNPWDDGNGGACISVVDERKRGRDCVVARLEFEMREFMIASTLCSVTGKEKGYPWAAGKEERRRCP